MKIDFKKLIIGVLVFSVLLVAFSLVYCYTYFLPQLEIKQIELEKQKQEQLEEQLEKEREEALERRRQVEAMKREYRDILSQVYTSERDIALLNAMSLSELEEAYNTYQEWEIQRQQQIITYYTEQLGIPAPFIEQIQRAYPEEEFEARLAGLATLWSYLQQKPSAEAMEDFMRFLFPPEPEE